MRCWCGAAGEHEHLCGGGIAFHPGYLLPWWELVRSAWNRVGVHR